MSAQTLDLPRHMKAVVCYGPEDYRLEEQPVPTPGPEEVVIRLAACGVCASDVKCFIGAPLFWGDALRPGYVQVPVIPGHELIGEVAALGEGAAEKYGLAVGDTAISEQIVPCWKCRYCLRGYYWMCQANNIYGFRQYTPGGWAEYMKFPAGAINHRVPSAMPKHRAALIEPLACSLHAVDRGNIQFGDVVVIAGAGTLGLGMVAAARLKNPGCLVVMDLNDKRLEVARQLGADVTINPGREEALQRVSEMTAGYGCDVYIEATGHPKAILQGLQMIRKLGTFVEFSVMAGESSVDWTIIGDSKELDIHGAHLGPYCYPIAIDYIDRGLINVDPIVTHQFPLEQYAEAIDMVHSGTDSIKVLLVP
ncbi:MAG: alcohol dehydrogenase catalytic domain-containing protein [Armatimonadetes bacterium]|nr:alcohol dehydrogenase catalytic domain-containing protein [Armatimonadota bacterium]